MSPSSIFRYYISSHSVLHLLSLTPFTPLSPTLSVRFSPRTDYISLVLPHRNTSEARTQVRTEARTEPSMVGARAEARAEALAEARTEPSMVEARTHQMTHRGTHRG